ncbi:MAG: 2-succinyl-5-enolpyruvyl-6-hydroxy-3-cyclohexene-1-carboxylate synthase [Anaerolineae bacterium]|nr:2-succinyl-5-enolpyruvyl-6-hydroxy-3-cyclohexene-1-carboxylate synthase [Anaerolineae bacterium]
MKKQYTVERHIQVLLALLKEHCIRKVVVSPGTTNMNFVASMQNDPYFEMYSSVDERSAAYMACGLAAESGEPVVITCTQATASRNYLSGLTEAYYRKLPVLAVTATQAISRVGHHIAQVIDRSSLPNDVVRYSVLLPIVKDEDDLWDCEIKVNRAILELHRRGGGPVHINLPTTYDNSFVAKELPRVRKIERITSIDRFPELLDNLKVAVFVGAHVVWTNEQSEALDKFCSTNNAVVFCDHTSNYKGKYRVLYALPASQSLDHPASHPDILIHIGEVSGEYYTLGLMGKAKEVWRVSEDGEIRDTFRKLRYVFEMSEQGFFEHYAKEKIETHNRYYQVCKSHLDELYTKVPELPFSNLWLASKMAHRIPEGSVIHFGILNSLRSWNFYDLPGSVFSASNVGGFGIDGNVSALHGASLANRGKLFFGIVGDLAFFYDLNVLGNRHIGNNLRIMLVNNGKGTEFVLYSHKAARFGKDAEEYIAAAGHFGNQSRTLVKHFAEDLGFEYFCAANKQEFEDVYERFLVPEITERPMLFEVFTDSSNESDALGIIRGIEVDRKVSTKTAVKKILGRRVVGIIRKVIRH